MVEAAVHNHCFESDAGIIANRNFSTVADNPDVGTDENFIADSETGIANNSDFGVDREFAGAGRGKRARIESKPTG